jgi:hypothetical protein
MPTASWRSILLYMFFATALLLNFLFWTYSKTIILKWNNVPQPPSATVARFVALGDEELAYRLMGYTLQNLGNAGGHYESLRNYDYSALEKWFFIANDLDPRSNYVPYMAAYYFGAVDVPEKASYLIDYLKMQGKTPYREKWRWFAHAVYLARYTMQDDQRALALADELAKMPGTAPWARQLPAFIQLNMGDKDAAYGIMLKMLQTEGDKLDQAEINTIIEFICTRTLDKDAAAQNPLCQNRKDPL